MLHDRYGVAGVGEAAQQPQQPIDVRRVQPDGRLVQHVQRVHEVRPECVREGDPLCLAARQGPGQTVERQVPEADVVYERQTRRELRQNVDGDRARERGQLEPRHPLADAARGQRGDFRDALPAHPDGEGFGLEARAAAGGASLGELVLAQEDPDVLLVPLHFEALEEREHAEEAAGRSVQQEMAVPLGQIAPRRIEGDPAGARRLPEDAPPALVARFGPGIERPLRQALLGVGHDERFVVLEHRPEAVAPRAGAAGVVEGEQDRRERGGRRGAVRARRVLGEATAVAVLERHGDALALVERGRDRVGEPSPIPLRGGEPVDHH